MEAHPETNQIKGLLADEALNLDTLMADDPADLVPRLNALFKLLQEVGTMPLQLTIVFANNEDRHAKKRVFRIKSCKIHINGKYNPTAGIYDETVTCPGCAFVGGIINRKFILPKHAPEQPTGN